MRLCTKYVYIVLLLSTPMLEFALYVLYLFLRLARSSVHDLRPLSYM
jgi:hypothetical protein